MLDPYREHNGCHGYESNNMAAGISQLALHLRASLIAEIYLLVAVSVSNRPGIAACSSMFLMKMTL